MHFVPIFLIRPFDSKFLTRGGKRGGGGGLQKVEILGTAMLEKSSNGRSLIENIFRLIAKD